MAEKDPKKESAKIEEVRIERISHMPRKPSPVSFHDTEVIVVIAKTNSGKEIRETFYTMVKPDGIVDVKPLGQRAKSTLQRLYRFVKYYRLAEKLGRYNIVEGVKTWVGKPVEIVYKNKIFIP